MWENQSVCLRYFTCTQSVQLKTSDVIIIWSHTLILLSDHKYLLIHSETRHAHSALTVWASTLCNTMNRSIEQHSLTTPTTSQRYHNNSLFSYLLPPPFTEQPRKHRSHKSSQTRRAQQAPGARWSPRLSFPLPPHTFRSPPPKARPLSVSHNQLRVSWLVEKKRSHVSFWVTAERLQDVEVNKSLDSLR